MTSDSPLLDLLVVGGMTIDRFADGSSSPGGTVMHVARAAAARGLRIGIVTTSGPEPEAQAGLAELRGLASLVETRTGRHTTAFRHREAPEGRRLWLDRVGEWVQLDASAYERIRTRAILYAPVAGEIAIDALTIWAEFWRRGAILQGWLRTSHEGVEIRPRPLSALDRQVVGTLAQFDLLVASREDLLAESDAPYQQLTALRRTFGANPALVVTDGADGIWLDTQPAWAHQSSRRHLPVPFTVEAASSVGAGDILAAFLTMESKDPSRSIDLQAQDAMRVVAEVLEQRRA